MPPKRQLLWTLLTLLLASLSLSCPTANTAPYNATIYTDIFGVPHVYGETEYDALYGMGYAMARDQLENMAQLYRRAQGKLASYEGPGVDFGNIASDYITRLFRIPQSGAEAYAQMPARDRKWLQAYTAGVNEWVREYNLKNSPNIEYFQPEGVAAWGLYISFGRQIVHALADLEEEVPIELKSQGAPLFSAGNDGSNQWAVSASLTDGPTLLYGDPHLEWLGSTQWYEVHIKTTSGSLNVTGAAVLGTPFIAVGHNEDVAWTLTSNTPSLDCFDVYEEELIYENLLTHYRYDPAPRGQKRIVKDTVVLRAKDFPLPFYLPAYYTHHGPIMPIGIDGIVPRFTNDGRHVYGIALSAMDSDEETYPGGYGVQLLRTLYRINTAESISDLRRALGDQTLPGAYPLSDAHGLFKWNMMAADRTGDTFFIDNGRCPIRVDAQTDDPDFYTRPIPGWTGDYEWQRDASGRVVYWPIAELPQLLNPPGGFMVNCNVSPWYICEDNGFALEDYPPYLVSDQNSERNLRAATLLSGKSPLTEMDMRVFGQDVHILSADYFEELLFSFYTPEDYPDLAAAAALLQAEPNEATIGNRSIFLLVHWFDRLRPHLKEMPAAPEELTEENKTVLINTLRAAVEELEACPLGLDPPWGEVHFFERGDVFPLAGGWSTVSTLYQAWALFNPCEAIEVSGGSSFSQVSVLTPEGITSHSVRPIGASSDPESPHYNDETARFALRDPELSYKPNPFTDEEVMQTYFASKTVLGSGTPEP